MSRFERIFRLHDLLRSARRPVPMRRLCETLEVQRNTVTRDMAYMRDILGAPIEYDRDANGHYYDPQAPVFELPGLWMNASELHALLACEQMLEAVQPGLMAPRLAPLKSRIRALLGEAGQEAEALGERVRVQPMQTRSVADAVFIPVAGATMAGKMLSLEYSGRGRNTTSTRTVAPQRLLHYRQNWYLLARCDAAQALRIFALDRIRNPRQLDTPAPALSSSVLDAFSGAAFGIFSGDPVERAHLRFSEHAARWVAEETWHSDQRGEWREDGYHLWVPYSDPTELLMDVLRYGSDVEVMGPEVLRERTIRSLRGALQQYGKTAN